MRQIGVDLWFDKNAEEAVEFYLSVFKDSRVVRSARYSADAAGPEGAIMYIQFELNGQRFGAINGGPHFKFNEAVSLKVECEDQAEIDYYWETLSAVPESEECGWVKDRFGVSWQIVPTVLDELMSDPDPARAQRATRAMLSSKKFNIAELQKAAAG